MISAIIFFKVCWFLFFTNGVALQLETSNPKLETPKLSICQHQKYSTINKSIINIQVSVNERGFNAWLPDP